jgi:hypothetical protein
VPLKRSAICFASIWLSPVVSDYNTPSDLCTLISSRCFKGEHI